MPLVTDVPLVVDLDGTLTPTDTLVESVLKVVRQSPLNLLRMPIWLMRGRAGFKTCVAARAGIAAQHLPYRAPLIDYLQDEKAKGRQIILATAAHRTIADSVAGHLGLFDQVLASDTHHNLKGASKLQAIRERVGDAFVYAGDSRADLPIWLAAEGAVLVDVPERMAEVVRQRVRVEREFHAPQVGCFVWLRALRVHQWLKNLLLLVPMLTAFSFTDAGKMLNMVLAFLAFSLTASATYILNDLGDLENDRAHPRKRLRPFASAQLPILGGLGASISTLAVAFGLAWLVSSEFVWTLMAYLALTSAYSWVLKSYMLVDVLLLSLLYTLRILAGAVAIGVAVSSWLLAFSVFIFLSLALVKRCAELIVLGANGEAVLHGRDYRVTDLVVLWPLGVGAALSAVVVFGLFIHAPETQSRYSSPQLLWLVGVGLIYWLARLWVKTARGEMHDDPVVFAAKDRGSRLTILAMVVVMLAAHFLTFGALS
ncbi:4-hydroxybenzoate polyprenyltransferase [Chitinivorax tropicus]|uniref:4-hydroxybenzoate polyprenyltransferase n=1 Tax=Chitinivorax tropicus TaxID=714531 RepID=A0A840MEG2_9PROT|nr:UbiA family prenyltransferase [Chitinivorax tropicus]MBB5017664.1 4-hydroxybenzoate polyprenyltransferase [Chitinivorax tropicus]